MARWPLCIAGFGGISRPIPYNVRIWQTDEGLPQNSVHAIAQTRDGYVWVGTCEGLARFDGVRFMPLDEAATPELRQGWITALVTAKDGSLWIAGDGLGVTQLKDGNFTWWAETNGLPSNQTRCLAEGSDGSIWIGTEAGLARYKDAGLNRLKGDGISALSSIYGLTHDVVLSLHQARDGSLWVGMDFEGGLNWLHDGGWDVFIQQDGLIGPVVRVIQEDHQQAIWVGTSRGLSVLRQRKFSNYTTEQGLAETNVMVIKKDHAGRMWIGTEGGLSRWDGGKFVNLTEQHGLSHNFVHAIHRDSDHTLWIGTKGGQCRLQGGKFTRYTSAQGLFSDEIYEIIEDDSGHFWFSCRRGIFRARKVGFDALDRGDIKSLTSTVFGKADELATVQCNGVAKPAAWKARDGRIWFPTIRGVVAVDARIETNDSPPPVVIEKVVANQRPLRRNGLSAGHSETLAEPPGRGEVEIHFNALSYRASEKNRFKYRLEGIDSAWIEAGPDRLARYYNVAPGHYRFQAIACNNEGVWNETGASLAMAFQPHYWQTWWFKLVLLAAVTLLLTVFYQARVRRLPEMENLRIQIAADLHDDVSARLTKVAMVTELVDRETPGTDRSKHSIQNISKTTREIIQAMDEIVWTSNPKNDSLDNLANYIFQYAQDYFLSSGVRCRLDVSACLPDPPMSTQQRHNLFMAVKEAMNNVIKHARASEMRNSMSMSDLRLTITVTDNGCGFSTVNPPASGDGLENLRHRLERIGGRLVVDCKPGGEARVHLEVKAE